MAMTNTCSNSLLLLLFNATTFDKFAENDTSSPATNLYLSLHTADPGAGGSQTTSEAAYTSYARVAVARSGSGWTVSSNNCSNAAIVNWPACTGSSATCTHWGIGTDSSGAGTLLFHGAMTSLAVTTGITPSAAIGAIDIDGTVAI
jgi:hypothetical protein